MIAKLRLRVLLCAAVLLGASFTTASAQDRLRDVIVVNDCDQHSWSFFVHYSRGKNQWATASWYVLGPGEKSHLNHNGRRVRHWDGSEIYVYAENRRRNRAISGDVGKNLGDRHYKMKPVPRHLRGDDVFIVLNC